MVNTQARSIRKKKLGVLIMDARLASGRKTEECANLLGISTQAYLAYEQGQNSPSLPELEALAFFLNIPLDHFWGNSALSADGDPNHQVNKLHQILDLRQRIVGTNLREARLGKDLSLDELSTQVDIPAEQLERYELGEEAIPLPDLETLSSKLGHSLQDFHDSHGPIGEWIHERRTLQQIKELPADLQAFVLKPINRPYLELAERLSEMSVEKLRAVAEGLLEITL